MTIKTDDTKIEIIDEALLENIAGGRGGRTACGPGDCTNHGGCENEEEEEQLRIV